jgi:uncharacterized protein (DUF433 family)
MKDEKLLERITINPEIFIGKPLIRGHRIAVEHILGMIASGASYDEILEGYPFLELDDIKACQLYAYKLVAHERYEPKIAI